MAQQENILNELFPIVEKSRKALCLVQLNGKILGSGFLIQFKEGSNNCDPNINGEPIILSGLMTSKHVVSSHNPWNCDLAFSIEALNITCALSDKNVQKQFSEAKTLDYTFFLFNQEFVQKLIKQEVVFLEKSADQQYMGAGIVLHHPNGKMAAITFGQFIGTTEEILKKLNPRKKECKVCDVFHYADTLPGSSGCPILQENGKVVAKHRASSSGSQGQVNTATNIRDISNHIISEHKSNNNNQNKQEITLELLYYEIADEKKVYVIENNRDVYSYPLPDINLELLQTDTNRQSKKKYRQVQNFDKIPDKEISFIIPESIALEGICSEENITSTEMEYGTIINIDNFTNKFKSLITGSICKSNIKGKSVPGFLLRIDITFYQDVNLSREYMQTKIRDLTSEQLKEHENKEERNKEIKECMKRWVYFLILENYHEKINETSINIETTASKHEVSFTEQYKFDSNITFLQLTDESVSDLQLHGVTFLQHYPDRELSCNTCIFTIVQKQNDTDSIICGYIKSAQDAEFITCTCMLNGQNNKVALPLLNDQAEVAALLVDVSDCQNIKASKFRKFIEEKIRETHNSKLREKVKKQMTLEENAPDLLHLYGLVYKVEKVSTNVLFRCTNNGWFWSNNGEKWLEILDTEYYTLLSQYDTVDAVDDNQLDKHEGAVISMVSHLCGKEKKLNIKDLLPVIKILQEHRNCTHYSIQSIFLNELKKNETFFNNANLKLMI